MNRRSFFGITASATAGFFIAGKGILPEPVKWDRKLDDHRITDLAFSKVRLNYPRLVGKNARLDIHGHGPENGIHVLYTNKGATGWGLNRASEKITLERFNAIKGLSVSDLLDPENGVKNESWEIFDFSLYDLAGRILKKPVYQLLGKKRPFTFPCYSGMIYFDDLEPADNPAGVDKIIEECRWDYNYGYRQFKLKIGRGYKWMAKEEGIKRDIEITRLVASQFPDCGILVDGNNGFTADEFIRYLEGINGIKLFWIEEPFHENVNDYVLLNSWLKTNDRITLLADGEASPDEKVLSILGSQGIIKVFIQDISGLGFTKWIKKIKIMSLEGILASPHAWGSAIKTNYISHLSGAFGNTATIEGVTCTSDDIDLSGYRLVNGNLIPSPGPGFGMDLLKKV